MLSIDGSFFPPTLSSPPQQTTGSGGCLTLASKNRCHNAVDRRHKKRNWARRCDINFLPVVHAVDADAPNAISDAGFPAAVKPEIVGAGNHHQEEESYEIPTSFEAEPSVRPDEEADEREKEEEKRQHREKLKQRLTCRGLKGWLFFFLGPTDQRKDGQSIL